MSSIEQNILKFPPKEKIIAYLNIHPRTNKQMSYYLTEKKIIQFVSEIFANQETDTTQIRERVLYALYDLQLGLTDFAIFNIAMNLTKALIDCANEEKIP